MPFVRELKRRNVFKVTVAYIIVAWLLLQVSVTLAPALRLPEWFHSGVAFVLILGFPVAIIFAWAFELTPEGLKREHQVNRNSSITHETGRKLEFVIVGLLIVAVAWFALDKFVWQPAEPTASTRDSAPSIAVLPFVNMSDDPANEYFSEGISEELLNLLAKIPQLKVIGRTSSFQFKGRQDDLRTIGDKLGVVNILEGSVRKAGNRVRVTAQLITVTDGTHLWSESYDRDLDDIFAVQNEIASSVVETLKVRLLGTNIPQRSSTKVTEAYDLYLHGNYFMRGFSPGDLEKALVYFQRAVQLDPQLAPAWERIGSIRINQSMSGLIPPDQGMTIARDAIEKALELDPSLGAAHYTLGFQRMIIDWDWPAAEAAYRRALAVEPNHAGALGGSGLLSLALGRGAEAIEYIKRSLRIDPLRIASNVNQGFILYRSGQSAAALQAFQHVYELAPDSIKMHYSLCIVLLDLGEFEAAFAEAQLEPVEEWRLAALALAHHALGRDDESLAATRDLEARYPDSAAAIIAEAHAYRGDSDAAFQWLERAVENRDAFVTFIKMDPLLANIKADPRFTNLISRLNLDD